MAENKKSFLLYCDIIHTIQQLTDEQAGNLFKHILQYVNDQNPSTDNVITNIAFEPIKQQLKRDLMKYDSIRKRNSENAKMRWDATACDRIPNHTKNADNDNDNDNDIKKKREKAIPMGDVPSHLVKPLELWLNYKKEKRQKYTKIGLQQLIDKMKKYTNESQAMQDITHSIANNWSGIYASSEKEQMKPMYKKL